MIQFTAPTFAQCYKQLIEEIQLHPVNISVRGNRLVYELLLPRLIFEVPAISIYSNPVSRATPIRFALAEFLWIMSGSDELAMINRFNGRMSTFSDDMKYLNGAYGKRLGDNIHYIIAKLIQDKYSRQGYAPIFYPDDTSKKSKDIPCNTALQYIIRDDKLHMMVVSRSSDFVTGLSIDGVHWQLLYWAVLNSLAEKYPEVTWGTITYQLTSLHVYATDREAMHVWKTEHDASWNYDRQVKLRDDYYSLRKKSLEVFPTCETLDDLLVLYNFAFYERDTLKEISRFRNQLAQR